MNYEEAMNFIQNTNKFGSVLGLDNIKELLERLGNPQDQLKVVHIAGTNGKGSTLAFLAGIFRESGYRAGRYVSPASFCYEERFRINEENISKEDLCFYMEKIKKISEEIATMRYVSAEEAWESYKKDVFQGNEELLEGFEGNNPLKESDSYEITLKEVKSYQQVVSHLETIDGVRKVRYSEGAAEGMTKINTMGTYLAGGIILILMAVSIFLVSNTVSIGVAVREEEISIMKLIGAANGFIKAPFQAEGMIIGILGSLIPTAIIFAGYEGIINWMNDKFHVVTVFMKFVPIQQIMLYLLPLALLVGIVIGLLGSSITIRKYLKV